MEPVSPSNSVPTPTPVVSISPVESSQEKSKKYLFYSIIFFPFGLLIAWKNGVLDQVLPTVCIVFSVLSLVTAGLIPMSAMPIINIEKTMKTNTTDIVTLTYLCVGLTVIISLLGIGIGVFYRSKIKKGKPLSFIEKAVLFFLIFAPVIVQLVYSQLLAASIYNSISSMTDFSQLGL